MEAITLNAPDISCAHCVATVEKTVGSLEGVEAVTADADTKNVNVTYDASKTGVSEITSTLEEAGYPAKA